MQATVKMHQPMTAQVVGGPLPRYEIYYAEDEGENKCPTREPVHTKRPWCNVSVYLLVAPGGIRRGAWKDGVCDWWRQWVPTCE